MAQYDLVSNDGTPFTTAADVEQGNEASGRNDNVVSRSLRGGVYGAGSQLTSLADAGAEAAGLDGVSKSLRGVSGGLREQAALPQNAPKVGSFRQLREDFSLDNAGEYVGGLVGGSLPVMAAGVAGGIATGGAGAVPAMLGAAAASAPFEMGDVVQKQQEDPAQMARPAGERLRDAVTGGAGSAALQGIVPGIVGRQVLGKAASSVARESVGSVVKRNAMDIPLEGATEGGGEAIKQTAAGQELDRESITEAAIGGAAAGGVFAGVGTGADLARSNAVTNAASDASAATGKAFTSIRERVAAAAGAAKTAGDAVAAPAKRVASLGEDLAGMFSKARESGGDAVQRVKSGAPLGDLKEWAGASGTRLKEMTDLSDNATAQKVKDWGATMLNDTGLTPERRQQVVDAMANAGDRASQMTMAGLKEAWDKGRAVMGKAQALRDSFKRRDVDVDAREITTPRIGDGDVIDVQGVKKSEDYSGTNKAIADKLGPLLALSQPDLAGNAEAMSIVSDSVRQAVERMPRGALTVDTMFRLVDALGTDTAAVLDAAFREIGDMEQRENFYVQLNELADLQKRTRKLEDLVAGALTEESQGMIRADQMGEFTRLLVSHARGERADPNAGPAQRAAAERHFREQMEQHFGPKATAISLAIEKEAGLSKDATEGEVDLNEDGSEAMPSEGGFDEGGNRVAAEQTDVIRKGRGKNNEPVMDPALFKSNGEAGQNYAAQLMLDMQAKYPGHDVRFEKAEGSTTHGYVVAEKAQDKDALSDFDIQGMKLDTKRYANSKDRIEVGGNILDTRRVAKVMNKKLPYTTEGQPWAQRTAEMFNAGVAALMERYGDFKVADSVVIGRVGNQDLTFGAAKKLDKRTEADVKADKRTIRMEELRAEYKLAKEAGATGIELAELRGFFMDLVKEQARELDAELAGFDDSSPRATAMRKLEASKPGEDGKRRLPRPMEDRDSDFDQFGNMTAEGASRVLDSEGRTELGADDNIRRVSVGEVREENTAKDLRKASRLKKSSDLISRSNMDGSAKDVGGRAPPLAANLNGAVMAAKELKRGEAAIGRKVGARLEAVIGVARAMSEEDVRLLATVGGDMTPAKVAEIVNDLARKYAGAVSESMKATTAKADGPGTKGDGAVDTAELNTQANADLEYLTNPPADYTTARARLILEWAQENEPKLKARESTLEKSGDTANADAAYNAALTMRQIIKKAKSVLEGDESLEAEDGGSPRPKARAAQVAASAGDKALIAELRSSADARGLQRLVMHLSSKAFTAFDMSKAGSGFGSMFGKGAYFTTSNEIIEKYERLMGLGGAAVNKYQTSLALADGEILDGTKTLREQHPEVLAKLRKGLPSAWVESHLDDRADQLLVTLASKKHGDDGAAKFFLPLGIKAAHHEERSNNGTQVAGSYVVFDPAVIGLMEKMTNAGALDGANERLAELVQDPDTAYALTTKKFSLDGEQQRGAKLAATQRVDDLLGRLSRKQEEADIEWQKVRNLEKKVAAGKASPELLADIQSQAEYLQGIADEVKPELEAAQEALKKLSAQATNSTANVTGTYRKVVEAHVLKVLGPKVRVEWKNLTHAGEFQRMRLRDIIRISVHALDPMSVAHHESLHAFFAQLRDVGATDVMNVLDKAASSTFVLDQLKAHFAGQPAVLAQLKDPEERVAYMYQMWATDPSFRVAPSTKGTLAKVAAFIRKVLGIWSNDEKALHIMGYFHSGEYAKTKPSVAAAAMAAAGRNPALDNARKMAEPITRFADAVVATGSGRMRDTEIPALIRLADIIKREHTDDAGGDRGFVPAARVERTKRLNELGNTLIGYEQAVLDEARDALQNNTRAPSPEARLAVRAIKGVLAQTRDYMLKAGVEVGNLGPDYFPRVWDFHFISKNQQAFRDMLAPHVASGAFKGNVDDFIKQMATRDGVEENTVSTQPGMQFKKERLLAFVTPAEAAPFVKKDLMGTLSSYVTQATRKAEWHRRLGDGKLERIMSDAKGEGATKADLDLALNYLRGIDGTLGDDINPHMRRLMGNMIVYQNVRLLPLAVFSSIVDPVGIMVRGGTVSDAWTTFKRGMSEIPQSYGKAGTSDRTSEAAELVGVIDSALLTSVMGDIYTQGMVGGTAQKINTAFFKYNMMEGLNRSFRVGATEAAMKFVVRHHAGGTPHSARWMAELGLRAGDVKVMPDGRPALTVAEGLSAAQEARVHAALNQWVDGAVLRPDAADKPLWMNDPRWALVSHLKQFVYSFQKVILARVAHELKMGNYTPMMALAAYVPVMIAADFAKGTLQGGGDQPEWKKGWDMGDYLAHGVQRAGLLGVGQYGVDISEDMSRGGNGLGALVGPTIEQFGDVVQALGGQREFGSVALKSMPANALYAEYARNGAVDDGGAAALE